MKTKVEEIKKSINYYRTVKDHIRNEKLEYHVYNNCYYTEDIVKNIILTLRVELLVEAALLIDVKNNEDYYVHDGYLKLSDKWKTLFRARAGFKLSKEQIKILVSTK